MIEFATAPPIGTIVRLDDQAYELRGTKPHTRQDGSASMLLDWETQCPKCGAPFELTTGLKAQHLRRLCGACKDGAKLVKGRRGRKVKVSIELP